MPPDRAAATRRYRDLPGPRGLPLLGNALQIEQSRLHEQFEAWSREYGPCYRIRLGPRRLLILSDHRVIGSVLRDRPERFRRPLHHGEIVREMGFAQGLFFANDDVWRRQRRMVMSALDPAHVKSYLPSLVAVAERLRGRWLKAAAAREEIDLQADLMRYTVDAIAGLAFGSLVNTLESDEDTIQIHLNRVFPAIARRATAPLPYWRLVKLRADRELEQSVAEVKRAIETFIAQARERLERDPELRARPRNLLEAMVVAAEENGGAERHEDIAGNVFMMLVAGEDTTANTIAWLIDFLYRHPESLRRARDEAMGVADPGTRLDLEHLERLRFIDACIHETMRLKPVAPLIPAQAIADTTLDGIEVPAGTIVIGLMRRDPTDERYFPEPMRFDPDRWLTSNAASVNSKTRISLPFGTGPRLCPGRYLALVEMKLAAATLLRNFSIEHVGTSDGQPVRELFAFAMGPLGLRMRLAAIDDRTVAAIDTKRN